MASNEDVTTFNSTVIKLFKLCISRELDGNVFFGARGAYDGLLFLYYGSEPEDRAIVAKYGLVKPPPNECCKSIILILHHTDITGPVKESFLKSIKMSGISIAVLGHNSKHALKDVDIERFNKAVERMTENQIKDAITRESFNFPDMAVLQTKTKFTGHWKRPLFNLQGEFHIKENMTITLPLMRINFTDMKIPMAYIKSMDANVYKLPYKENLSMLVYIPQTVVGFNKLWTDISIFNGYDKHFDETLLGPLTMKRCTGITMPEYEYSTDLDISKRIKEITPYNRLNMDDVFVNPTSDESSYRFKIHSHIINSEDGTATKSSFTTMQSDRGFSNFPHIHINRPFAYYIIQGSNDIVNLGIFMGRECNYE